ncbi:MAG: hypothetical protein LBC65_00240 [Oscillospiraceae bacterium]|nr:hypothetical protein [Oscillospiraceae bacterium]
MNRQKMGSSVWFGLITVLIAVGIIAYLTIYARDAMQSGILTVEATEYVSYDTVNADGIVTRDEDPIRETDFGSFVYIAAEDGKHVAVGEIVAYSYTSETVWKSSERKHLLELAIADLSGSLDALGQVSQERFDTMLRETIMELKLKSGSGDYRVAREIAERLMIVAKASADAGASIEELRRERDSIPDASTSSLAAASPALFSRYVDGFLGNARLDPQNIETVMPDELTILMHTNPPTSNAIVGKLVYGKKWYMLANVDARTGASLAMQIGKNVKMLVDGLAEPLTMEVESVSLPQSNLYTVVFSCNYALREASELRIVKCSLIMNEYKGLRVPRDALRLEARTSGGQAQPCVYIAAGPFLERKFVKILYEEEDFYILADDVYTDDALRDGDLVVVGGTNLYDGKIITS